MPLRRRIRNAPETIQDLALASEERYWDGVELLVSNRVGSGVYLLGYVAEMILKRAFFQLDGADPFDLVGPRLGPVRTWARSRGITTPHEGFHSLTFWLRVLRTKRAERFSYLPHPIDARLVQGIHRCHGIWLVDMRYQPSRLLPSEVRSIYDDVTWLRDQQHHLGV